MSVCRMMKSFRCNKCQCTIQSKSVAGTGLVVLWVRCNSLTSDVITLKVFWCIHFLYGPLLLLRWNINPQSPPTSHFCHSFSKQQGCTCAHTHTHTHAQSNLPHYTFQPLKMGAACSCETLVSLPMTTWCNNPRPKLTSRANRCDHLKSVIVMSLWFRHWPLVQVWYLLVTCGVVWNSLVCCERNMKVFTDNSFILDYYPEMSN
jgi:hypothetical protein